jgi:hypothetical protein
MTTLRTIWTDLVERRLWPVALGLVAALVAVPMVLAGGAKTPAPAPVAAGSSIAHPGGIGVTAQAAISVATPQTARRDRAGAVRNPFIQPVHKTVTSTVSPISMTPPGSTSTPSSSLPSPSTGSAPSGGGGGTTYTPIAPPAKTHSVWHVNLRFGEAGKQHIHHDVPRLTPLPSGTDPFFVFLGILADGKTAVFLVSSDATANGDGKCKPSAAQCDTIEMRAGDTEFFDVTQGNSAVIQYELDLLKVSRDKVTGTAAAHAARRMSRTGHTVVQELKAEGDASLGHYIYSYSRGVLIRRHGARVKASAVSSNISPDVAHSSVSAPPSWGG